MTVDPGCSLANFKKIAKVKERGLLLCASNLKGLRNLPTHKQASGQT